MAAMPQIQSDKYPHHTQPLPGYWTSLSNANACAAALKRVSPDRTVRCYQNSWDTAAAAGLYQKGAEKHHHSTTTSLFRAVRDKEREREKNSDREMDHKLLRGSVSVEIQMTE